MVHGLEKIRSDPIYDNFFILPLHCHQISNKTPIFPVDIYFHQYLPAQFPRHKLDFRLLIFSLKRLDSLLVKSVPPVVYNFSTPILSLTV